MGLTIQKLADMADVSDATVSLVLSNKHKARVSEATRRRILRLARKHGYRLNVAAKGLREGRTYRVGLCTTGEPDSHPIMGEYSLYQCIALFSRAFRAAGYGIEIQQIAPDHSVEQVGEELGRKSVDGFVFLTPWRPDSMPRLFAMLRERGMGAAACGTALNEGCAWTDIDRRATIEEATCRLLGEAHKRIVFLEAVPAKKIDRYAVLMRQSFVDTMKRELDEDAEQWAFGTSPATLEEVLRVTEQALEEVKGATAFLLRGNFYGEAVIHVLKSRGMEPGRDFRIIGFGDAVHAERCSPKLSHYSLRIPEQVEFCIEALMGQMQNPTDGCPSHRLFPPKFIELGT